ncbi:hypothetical protein MKW94_005480 [Papaver nudicaule]|uniref:Hydrophobic protein OSR8 n=1 Tax=Papaver nudicaule TaxID=74823 RepID=A0AA41V9T8_PAPNU|nr:hypothetical protein [Papaver nudicaule]
MGLGTFCDILIAILLPPLGVCLKTGCCTVEFLICVVLTILGYIPGIVYAVYVISKHDGREFGTDLRRPINDA